MILVTRIVNVIVLHRHVSFYYDSVFEVVYLCCSSNNHIVVVEYLFSNFQISVLNFFFQNYIFNNWNYWYKLAWKLIFDHWNYGWWRLCLV